MTIDNHRFKTSQLLSFDIFIVLNSHNIIINIENKRLHMCKRIRN
jgi:hypothetical protein